MNNVSSNFMANTAYQNILHRIRSKSFLKKAKNVGLLEKSFLLSIDVKKALKSSYVGINSTKLV